MNTVLKNVRAQAWQHELDLVDDEVASRHFCRERAKRVALYRSIGACASASAKRDSDLPDLVSAMPRMPLSRHAAHRMKNRGIRLEQVLVVASFGRPQPSHGATRYVLDRKSRQLLAETMSAEQLKRLGAMNIVAVFADDGALITAAHRTQRLFND